MKTKAPFYNKFVNEENIKNLSTKINHKFWIYSVLILGFSVASVTIITFVGYNFVDSFGISTFIYTFVLFLIVIICIWRLISLDKKYHTFHKHWHFVVLLSIYLVLDIIFYIAAIFTTKFTILHDRSILISVNPFFYFCIYLPLIFSYNVFCYFAYIKCICKYGSAKNNLK